MGKWASIESKLPKFQPEATWQAKVDQAKTMYVGQDLKELARQMGIVQNMKDEHEAAVSGMNIEIEALSQLLIDEMRAQGMEKVGLDSGAAVSIDIQPYSSTEDKTKMLDYFRRNKLLRQMMTVNWQTINGMNKDRLVAGKKEIPGTKLFYKISAKLGKARETESEAA